MRSARVAVDDEHLVTVEFPLATLAGGRQGDRLGVPAAGVFGQGQSGDGRARGDPGQEVLLGAPRRREASRALAAKATVEK